MAIGVSAVAAAAPALGPSLVTVGPELPATHAVGPTLTGVASVVPAAAPRAAVAAAVAAPVSTAAATAATAAVIVAAAIPSAAPPSAVPPPTTCLCLLTSTPGGCQCPGLPLFLPLSIFRDLWSLASPLSPLPPPLWVRCLYPWALSYQPFTPGGCSCRATPTPHALA